MRDLTVLEQMILAAILNQGENAYGVSIRRTVRKRAGRALMYGTLYKALDQLGRKGYVSKRRCPAPPEGKGGRKVFYTVTPSGRKALAEAFALHRALSEIVPDSLFGGEG